MNSQTSSSDDESSSVVPAVKVHGSKRDDFTNGDSSETGTKWPDNLFGRPAVGDASGALRIVREHELHPSLSGRARPDNVSDGSTLNGLVFRAASVRGLAHLWQLGDRQDSYLVSCTQDRSSLILAVADGVASAKFSSAAADIACQEFIKEAASATANVDSEYWYLVSKKINAVVADRAVKVLKQHAVDIDDAKALSAASHSVMSTTLVGAVFNSRPSADGSHEGVAIRFVGDSSAWTLDGRLGVWRPVFDAKNVGAEVLSSGVTAYPTAHLPRPLIEHVRLLPGNAFVLMSDGVSDPLAPAGIPVEPVSRLLAKSLAEPSDPLDFARIVGFHCETWDDDRTAVALWVGAHD